MSKIITVKYSGKEAGFQIFKGYVCGIHIFTFYYRTDILRAEMWTKEKLSREDVVHLFNAIKDDLFMLGVEHAFNVWAVDGNYIYLIHSDECDSGQCPLLRGESEE